MPIAIGCCRCAGESAAHAAVFCKFSCPASLERTHVALLVIQPACRLLFVQLLLLRSLGARVHVLRTALPLRLLLWLQAVGVWRAVKRMQVYTREACRPLDVHV